MSWIEDRNLIRGIVKPKSEPMPGYEWKFRVGCDCKSCPWKGHCRGESYPHWVEVRKP